MDQGQETEGLLTREGQGQLGPQDNLTTYIPHLDLKLSILGLI